MHSESILPITWVQFDFADTLLLTFYDACFQEDFGVFKVGETVKCLGVDYGKGELTEYDDEGEILRTQSFVCKPK